jgi:aryl-alcohol dehydrogenase-like predicted oxidoreductase
MQSIELGNSGLRAPALGFGCAALMGRVGRRESLRALDAAWKQGIRFFDTARSYGYGESEGLLGEFLRGRREQAVIATKFGILAAPQPGWKKLARAAARQVLAAVPGMHGLLRKGAATQFVAGKFTVQVLEQSIAESLRALGTDHVDFLFLHAAPASVLDQDDLLEALGRLVEAGKVRAAGLSAEPDVVRLALERQTAPLRAMQFPCNLFDLSAAGDFARLNHANHLLVANHPFGGVARVQQCRQILIDLAASPATDADLRQKLGDVDDAILADVVLNAILRDSGIHVVIPAMMRPSHIQTNIDAVTNSRFDAGEIAALRTALLAAAATDAA